MMLLANHQWFDALVNKVITEGDDVTKRFATGERQSIHQKTLDDGSVVRVTEDVDDGAVRVEYESDEMFLKTQFNYNIKNHYRMRVIQDQQQSLHSRVRSDWQIFL